LISLSLFEDDLLFEVRLPSRRRDSAGVAQLARLLCESWPSAGQKPGETSQRGLTNREWITAFDD
jgi:hypothetical protein